jgi:hypothetical protein
VSLESGVEELVKAQSRAEAGVEPVPEQAKAKASLHEQGN